MIGFPKTCCRPATLRVRAQVELLASQSLALSIIRYGCGEERTVCPSKAAAWLLSDRFVLEESLGLHHSGSEKVGKID